MTCYNSKRMKIYLGMKSVKLLLVLSIFYNLLFPLLNNHGILQTVRYNNRAFSSLTGNARIDHRILVQ